MFKIESENGSCVILGVKWQDKLKGDTIRGKWHAQEK